MMNKAPRIDFLPRNRLAICRPSAQLDAEFADWLLLYIIGMESGEPQPFNRLLDLTSVIEIRLNGPELYEFALLRRLAMPEHQVRTAILGTHPVAYGVGKTYEMLMRGAPIEVRTFQEAEPAADWLQVPVSVVVGPSPQD